MIKTSKQKWTERLEDAQFLDTMFEMYLKRTGQWNESWDEVIGARMHYRDTEFRSMYDHIDGDFVELFILPGDGATVRKTVLLSGFLEWQARRGEKK